MMMKIVLFTLFLSLSLTKCEQTVRSRTLKYSCDLKPLQHTLPSPHDNQARIPDLEDHKATVTGTCFFFCRVSWKFSMSHAVCKTSATNLDPRFKTNSATSVLPSSFCSLANADDSVYDFIFLATTIRHVHTKTFVFYDYYLCYFSARDLGWFLHCNL